MFSRIPSLRSLDPKKIPSLPADILFEVARQSLIFNGPIVVDARLNNRVPIDSDPINWRTERLFREVPLEPRERDYKLEQRAKDIKGTSEMMAFTYTSRECREHCTAMYYSENTFKFADTYSFEWFAKRIGKKNLGFIKKIEIVDESDDFGHSPLTIFARLGMPFLKNRQLPLQLEVSYPGDKCCNIFRAFDWGKKPHWQIRNALEKVEFMIKELKLDTLKKLTLRCEECNAKFEFTAELVRRRGEETRLHWTQSGRGRMDKCVEKKN